MELPRITNESGNRLATSDVSRNRSLAAIIRAPGSMNGNGLHCKYPFPHQKLLYSCRLSNGRRVFRLIPFFSPPSFSPLQTERTPFVISMCVIHTANCTRCNKVAACWQTRCCMVNPQHDFRTCGALTRKTEPPGLCSACLERGPHIIRDGRPGRHARCVLNTILVRGKIALSKWRMRIRRIARSQRRVTAPKGRPRRQGKEQHQQQQGSEQEAPRQLGYKAVLYHPQADKNHPGTQVLYRAIYPGPPENPSIIRVRNVRNVRRGENFDSPYRSWSMKGFSSAYAANSRRTSWPPPPLHMRAVLRPMTREEALFRTMEDIVPCAGGLVSLSAGQGLVNENVRRPTSW